MFRTRKKLNRSFNIVYTVSSDGFNPFSQRVPLPFDSSPSSGQDPSLLPPVCVARGCSAACVCVLYRRCAAGVLYTASYRNQSSVVAPVARLCPRVLTVSLSSYRVFPACLHSTRVPDVNNYYSVRRPRFTKRKNHSRFFAVPFWRRRRVAAATLWNTNSRRTLPPSVVVVVPQHIKVS